MKMLRVIGTLSIPWFLFIHLAHRDNEEESFLFEEKPHGSSWNKTSVQHMMVMSLLMGFQKSHLQVWVKVTLTMDLSQKSHNFFHMQV